MCKKRKKERELHQRAHNEGSNLVFFFFFSCIFFFFGPLTFFSLSSPLSLLQSTFFFILSLLPSVLSSSTTIVSPFLSFIVPFSFWEKDWFESFLLQTPQLHFSTLLETSRHTHTPKPTPSCPHILQTNRTSTYFSSWHYTSFLCKRSRPRDTYHQ